MTEIAHSNISNVHGTIDHQGIMPGGCIHPLPGGHGLPHDNHSGGGGWHVPHGGWPDHTQPLHPYVNHTTVGTFADGTPLVPSTNHGWLHEIRVMDTSHLAHHPVARSADGGNHGVNFGSGGSEWHPQVSGGVTINNNGAQFHGSGGISNGTVDVNITGSGGFSGNGHFNGGQVGAEVGIHW